MADEAIARAKELDAYYKETGKLMGPLVSDLAYRNTRGMSNALQAWCSYQCEGAHWN
jgi:hypothetical protein